jgi:DNA-binding beta-propeller fold protein YncE
MTNRKFSRKRIGQVLGLLVLSFALIANAAPATWTVSAVFFFGAAAQSYQPKELRVAYRVIEEVEPISVYFPNAGNNTLGIIELPAAASMAAATAPQATGSQFALLLNQAPPQVKVQVKTVPVGTEPHSVDITPDGSRAFVGNFGSGDVSVVEFKRQGDELEAKVVETIKVGRQPTSLDFDPNSNKLYVNNFGDSNVSVIDVKATGGSQVVATIRGFREPIFVRISPDGKRGYVSSQRRGEGVAVFDTATNTITGRIALPDVELRRLALSPDSKRLYVAVRTDISGTG